MERRTILELTVLYELEPTLRDVFVEGPTDRAFFQSTLNRLGVNTSVSESDLVDVRAQELEQLGLTEGARQRVIAIAVLLEALSPVDIRSQVVCIIDADLDSLVEPEPQAALLVRTDYSAVELYAYDTPVLQRYLDEVVLGFPLSASGVMRAIEPVLRELSLCRLGNTMLSLRTEPVDFARDCRIVGNVLVLDVEPYRLRFLNKASATHRRGEFTATLELAATKLPSDARLWIHGEDLLDVLHWMVVQLRGPKQTVPRPLLGRTLLLAVPLETLAELPLFRELLARLGPQADPGGGAGPP